MKFTNTELVFLLDNYPKYGKMYCCEKLGRTEASIRKKTADLGLVVDKNGPFFKEWQSRARQSKIGKKRPEQADVMRKNHREGKLIRSEETNRKLGRIISERIKEFGHPKGMLGKTHTPQVRKIISENSKRYQAKLSKEEKTEISKKAINTKLKNGTYMNHAKSSNAYSRTKSGKREDMNGQFFRSGTEANFARYLNYIKLPFEFETKEFFFEEIKKGSRFYLCDFYIPSKDIYYEVKGWLDSKSITKFKRMKKYYPVEFKKLHIVKQSLRDKDYQMFLKIGFLPMQIIDFKDIEQLKGVIPNWE